MNIVLWILWLVSFWGWLYYLIEDISNKTEDNKYQKGMWICLVFMWIFALLRRIIL